MSSFPETIRIATRRSPLAMTQTRMVADALRKATRDQSRIELLDMSTSGDRQRDWSLSQAGGKGLFTKELEDAMLAGEADLAIHSAKDLPTTMPDGLALLGFLPRAATHDILVTRYDAAFPPRSIATGSPRRQAQLRRLFPETTWAEIRGNVETRLGKVASGECDATVLAAAGLARLGIHTYPGVTFHPLSLEQCVPAPGQAAIAIQGRREDLAIYASLGDAATARAVHLERHLLALLGEGCHSATAAHMVEDRLLVFQESCGYRAFPMNGLDESECRAAIDRIVETLLR